MKSQKPDRQPVVTRPDHGQTVAVVGDVYRFLATGEDTAGRYATWEAIVLPGGGPPPHVHSREEESFYVVQGTITVQIADQRLVAGPGMFVSMPPGIVHCFKNEGEEPAKMLISVVPAGLEKMFLEFGQHVAIGATPSPPSREEIAKLLEIAPRFGVEIRMSAAEH